MFVTNWISTTKIQKISEITNFFRHYFLSRTEVVCYLGISTSTSRIDKSLRWAYRRIGNESHQHIESTIKLSRNFNLVLTCHK